MNVIKRDCSLEEFDKNKIYIAIVKAMSCGNGIKTDVAQKIANETEKQWLNNYHKDVYTKLSPYLDEEEKAWLEQETGEV